MNRLLITLVAASVAMTAIAPAQAQDRSYRRPDDRSRRLTATLYESPNFEGRSITVTDYDDNLAGGNFNDMAASARFSGRWRLCADSKFRGKCQDFSGEIADFEQVGLGRKISSLQAYYEGWDRDRWDGGQGLEGARSVLFPYPSYAGFDLAAESSAADAFCHGMRLGGSAYYDSSESAPRALDEKGRYVGSTNVLRDVLCRR